MVKKFRRMSATIFHSYSEIFFLRSSAAGFLFLLITFFNPNVAISGLITVAAAYVFARFIHMGDSFLNTGFYTYNPLLVGLSIGYLFKLSFLTLFFLVAMGIFTYIISVILYYVFYTYFRLPVFSLPFVLVTFISYLASSKFTNLYVTSMYSNFSYQSLDLNLPYWLMGYFKAFGVIFFQPFVVPGILTAIIVLIMSRILFLMSILGYFVGSLTMWMLVGSSVEAFSNINNFNFILIAMAVGSVYLVPSVKSFTIAGIAVGIATIFLESVSVFWSTYAIPGFTLPFNIISLSFIYMLGLIEYPDMIPALKNTPEEALDNYISNKRRYRGFPIGIMLPFSGKWSVWQGFNGSWTHKGNWKYAYDFIITDEKGNSYKNDGTSLDHFYCYKKPVLAPIRGRVVKVVNSLQDNDVGKVDKVNNWGNLVIIQSEDHYYVELSHLSPGSVKCREGDWVERGSFIGACGNSGYSPQPHIHIQVQKEESIGAYSLPFSFISYAIKSIAYSHGNPKEKDILEPLHWDKSAENSISFTLDESSQYKVLHNGKEIDQLHTVVKLESDGTTYLDSGKGKLYFGFINGTLYHYSIEGDDPYLALFMIAIPRMPLAYRKGLQWSDTIPSNHVLKPVNKILTQFIQAFYQKFNRVDISLVYSNENSIEGTIKYNPMGKTIKTLVKLDKQFGFSYVKVDNLELFKLSNEA